MDTYKIVYYLKDWNNGQNRGVALVEAVNRSDAMYYFQTHYAGQYSTIETCEKLLG